MDKTPLSGFEQDDFVVASKANERSVASLIEEYKDVRTASIALFKNMTDASLSSLGICGHERHHINIIKEQYL